MKRVERPKTGERERAFSSIAANELLREIKIHIIYNLGIPVGRAITPPSRRCIRVIHEASFTVCVGCPHFTLSSPLSRTPLDTSRRVFNVIIIINCPLPRPPPPLSGRRFPALNFPRLADILYHYQSPWPSIY